MCRIDVSFNFSFMFTATLSKWRSKSRRESFGTYEFGGSISQRFFFIISHWNRCQICCGCSSQNYEFGGSISLSYLSYLWRMKLLINQRFICEGVFLWTFALKSSAFGQLCSFFAHLFHIFDIFTEWDLAVREFWKVFFFFHSGVEHIKTIQRSSQYPPLTQCQCLHPLHPSPPQHTAPSQSSPLLSSSTRKIQVSVMVLMFLHALDENETFGQLRDC